MKSPIDSQKQLYSQRFRDAGDSPEGVFWNDRETQHLRFERLLRQFMPTPEAVSIHDVGCGTAELHSYLSQKKISHSYSGSELVSKMVECIKSKNKSLKVFNRNILDAPSNEHYGTCQ